MSALTDWRHLGLEAALGVLDAWSGHRVIVSVDLAAGACGLAGMAGVLRPARREEDAFALELVDCEAWLRLPAGACFRGASYDEEAQVLVLEFSSEGPFDAPAVLVDMQLAAPASRPAPLRVVCGGQPV